MSEELNVPGIARENILITQNCHKKFESTTTFLIPENSVSFVNIHSPVVITPVQVLGDYIISSAEILLTC